MIILIPVNHWDSQCQEETSWTLLEEIYILGMLFYSMFIMVDMYIYMYVHIITS